MRRIRLIPALLLAGRALVKTVAFRKRTYVGDPINAVKVFNDKAVDELVVLDVAAARQSLPPNYEMIADLASECFMPLSYGGGIRTVDEVERILSLGVEKVVIGRAFFENRSFVGQLARTFGSQSIVVSIDARRSLLGRYRVYTRGGGANTGLDPVSAAVMAEGAGAGEILLTAVSREGTFRGYDINMIRAVTERVGVPVIASGGAGTLADLAQAILAGGASAVAAGSMFVFSDSRRSVLINYPTEEEMKRALSGGGQ